MTVFHARTASVSCVLVLALSAIGTDAFADGPALLWPLSVVHREGDDQFCPDGLTIDTGRSGICDTVTSAGSDEVQRMDVSFTNCDGSSNYDGFSNVTGSCWPLAQKDANDNWLVPQGEYRISVCIADYGGAAAVESVDVKVDRGQKEQPARGQ